MASILKHDALVRGGELPQPIAFNMEDVQSRAREYLAEVQQQAAAILQQAQADANQLRQQAQREGLAAAQQQISQQIATEAKALSDQRCKTAIAACELSVQELIASTTEWLEAWRDQTVRLSLRMAEKLVRKELSWQPEAIFQRWLEEALRSARDSRELKISVHPTDYEIAGQTLEKLAKSIPQAAQATVVCDPEVKVGGCVLVSEHGSLDLQLETQLERIAEQLDSAEPTQPQ